MTFTLNVQDAETPMVAFARLTAALPAAAVIVPPPQEPVSPLGVAIVSPDGKVSVNATPVNDSELLGLVMVKLRLVDEPGAMLEAPNDLEIDGAVPTIKVADATFPLPPSFELTAPVVLV